MAGDGMPTIVYRGEQCASFAEFWNRKPPARFAMLKYLRWMLDGAQQPTWAVGEARPTRMTECYDRVDQDNVFAPELPHLREHWFPLVPEPPSKMFRVLSWFIDNNGNYGLDPGEIAGFGYPGNSFGKKMQDINARGFIEAFEASFFLDAGTDRPNGSLTDISVARVANRTFEWRDPPSSERVRDIQMYWVCGKDYSVDMQVFWDQRTVTIFTVTPPYAGPPSDLSGTAPGTGVKNTQPSGMILVRDFGAPFQAADIRSIIVTPADGG